MGDSIDNGCPDISRRNYQREKNCWKPSRSRTNVFSRDAYPLRNASVNREKYDRPPGRWVHLRLLDRCYSCPGASVMNFKILLLRSSYVARNNFLVGMEDRLVDL